MKILIQSWARKKGESDNWLFWGRVNTSYTPTKSPLNHLSSICFSSKFYIWMANAEHLFNGHAKFIHAHRGFFSLTDLRYHSESKYIAVFFFCYCFLYYWYYYFFRRKCICTCNILPFQLKQNKIQIMEKTNGFRWRLHIFYLWNLK